MKYLFTALPLAYMCISFADINDQKESVDQKIQGTSSDPAFANSQEGDIFVSADFIYWTVRPAGLPNDTSTTSQATNTGPNASQIHDTARQNQSNKNKNSPGFRAGVGCNLHYDGWSIYSVYTYFHTSRHADAINTSSTGTHDPNPVLDTISTTTSLVPSSWQLHFNTLDLDITRNIIFSKKLLLRPAMGLKGTWQKQNYHITTNTTSEIKSTPRNNETFDQVTISLEDQLAKQYFWGFGPRIGVWANWQFNRNWGLFSDVFLDMLWGRVTESLNVDASVVTLDSLKNHTPALNQTSTTNTNMHFHTLCVALELTMGAKWDYWFSDDNYHVGINAGWEYQVWLGQPNTLLATSGGWLGLQGLTLSFRFDF
jgi:hypothetical protein